WHCDGSGRYSMYSTGVTTQNFLRGVQVTDGSGNVTFTTIFPGCYAGRWPHIHFELYASAAAATSGQNAVRTSQLALPQATCQAVYTGASALYPSSSNNLSQVSLASDNVFSDGVTLQMPVVGGDNANGYAATLQVGVAGPTV